MRLRVDRTMHGQGGFTLIELLIVVVIIGILAAIAIPQFSNTKEKAFDASAKGELRNLMTAQEAYLASDGEYAQDLATLTSETRFNPTSNVDVSLNKLTGGSYQADASHSQSPHCYRVEMSLTSDQTIERVEDAGSGGGTCGG